MNLAFLGAAATLAAVISGVSWWYGAPVVLLFSGLEIFVLFLLLARVFRKGMRQEVIYLTDEEVVVECGKALCEERHAFQRFHTRIELSRPAPGWGSSRVIMACRTMRVPIGQFLTEQERMELVGHLRRLVVCWRKAHC